MEPILQTASCMFDMSQPPLEPCSVLTILQSVNQLETFPAKLGKEVWNSGWEDSWLRSEAVHFVTILLCLVGRKQSGLLPFNPLLGSFVPLTAGLQLPGSFLCFCASSRAFCILSAPSSRPAWCSSLIARRGKSARSAMKVAQMPFSTRLGQQLSLSLQVKQNATRMASLMLHACCGTQQQFRLDSQCYLDYINSN